MEIVDLTVTRTPTVELPVEVTVSLDLNCPVAIAADLPVWATRVVDASVEA